MPHNIRPIKISTIILLCFKFIDNHSSYIPAQSSLESAVNATIQITIYILVVDRLVVLLFFASCTFLHIQKADIHWVLDGHLQIVYCGFLTKGTEEGTGTVYIVHCCHHLLGGQQLLSLFHQKTIQSMYIIICKHNTNIIKLAKNFHYLVQRSQHLPFVVFPEVCQIFIYLI